MDIPPAVRGLLNDAQRLTRASDMRERALLLARALSLVDPAQNEELWANLEVRLGDALQQIPDGDVHATLGQAVDAYRAALRVYSEAHTPDQWAAVQNNLAIALRLRVAFEAVDSRHATLDEAIEAYRAALRVYTEDRLPLDWAMSHNNLAIALRARAALETWDRQRATLDEAIDACRAALRVYSEAHHSSEWAITQNSLAIALRARAALETWDRQRATLDEAIDACRAALRVYSEARTPTKWAAIQHNLAIALRARAALETGENLHATLDEAIEATRSALRVYTEDRLPLDWAMSHNALANALLNRALLEAGDARRATLMATVAACHAALAVYTPAKTPAQWAMSQNNLANALAAEAALEEGDARRGTFDEAIGAYHAALTVYSEVDAPAEWAKATNNLAVALWQRAQQEVGEGRRRLLRDAVSAYRAALRIYREHTTPDEWATTLNNLAIALRATALLEERETRRATLEEAIGAYGDALRVRTEANAPADWAATRNNLAVALGDRAALEERETRRATLEEAIGAYGDALRYYRRDPLPADHRDVARRAGVLLACEDDWARASVFFSAALDAQDDLFRLGVTVQGRYDVLSTGSDLPALTAYALARSGRPDAAQRATLALERGRARASGEAILRQQAQLGAVGTVAPDLLEEFRRVNDRLISLSLQGDHREASSMGAEPIDGSSGLQDPYTRALAARADYDATLARVRSVVPDFLSEQDPLPSAVATLRPDERLAYIAGTFAGSIAIMLSGPSGPREGHQAEVWRDEQLTTSVLAGLLEQHEGGDDAMPVVGGLMAAQGGVGSLDEALHRAMEVLGTPEGVVARLGAACRSQAIRHLILIPCGLYGLLPLHAALIPAGPGPTADPPGAMPEGTAADATPPLLAEQSPGRRPGREARAGRATAPLQDVVRVSYAPSARILAACSSRQLSPEADPSDPEIEMLVVGNPLPQPYGRPLPGAAAEARALRRLVSSAPRGRMVPPDGMLEAEAARYRPVLAALRAYGHSLTHAHFACHGLVEWREPERSGLLLANGARLMVRDLLDPQLMHFGRLRLVTLSACQTGLPGTRLPDEVVSLPAAWLQAGAAGVVGSLWTVSDSATIALMTKFYELHLLDGLEPGEALWLAQRWLRGIPQWRQDFLEAGAPRAAEGPEAHLVVGAIARSRGEAVPFGDVEDGAQGASDAVSGLGEMARHWAAFAHYGS